MNPVAHELDKLGHEYQLDGQREHFEEIINDFCKVYEIKDTTKIDDKDKEFALGYYIGISDVLNEFDDYMFDNLYEENTITKLQKETIEEAKDEIEDMILSKYIDLLTSIFDGYVEV